MSITTAARADRLAEEKRLMAALAAQGSFVSVSAPEEAGGSLEYDVKFACQGIESVDRDTRLPKFRHEHWARVTCGPHYPVLPPKVQFLTPMYHPDISGTGFLEWRERGIVGWNGEIRLVDVCELLYDLIRYAKYTQHSHDPRALVPQNAGAANWVREFGEPRPLVNEDREFPDVRRGGERPAPQESSPEVRPTDPSAAAAGATAPVIPPTDAREGDGSDRFRLQVVAQSPSGEPLAWEATFQVDGVSGVNVDYVPLVRATHVVEIRRVMGSPDEYHLQFVTKIFHPNLPPDPFVGFRLQITQPHAGRGSLVGICRWLYDTIRYARYDTIKSVRNLSAKKWVEDSGHVTRDRPLDPRPFPDPHPAFDERRTPGPPERDSGGSFDAMTASPVYAAVPLTEAGHRAYRELTDASLPRGSSPAPGRDRPRGVVRIVKGPDPSPPAPPPAPQVTVRPWSPRAESSALSALLDYELTDGTRVRAVLPVAACADMVDHARDSKRRMVEVGGFLLGTVEEVPGRDGARGYLITVTDVLRARPTSQSLAEVSFGVDAWQSLTTEADRLETAGKKRLGWYHTHPDQGIFFSAPDLNSHLEWRQPYQIGLVIDPQKMECGLMFWKAYPPRANAPAGELHESLGGPLLFPLQFSGGNGGARGYYSGAPAGRSRPADSPPRPSLGDSHGAGSVVEWNRFAVAAIFYVLMMVVVAADLLLTRDRPPVGTPLSAALVGVFGLFALARVWNTGFFHLTRPAGRPADGRWVVWQVAAGVLAVGGAFTWAAVSEAQGPGRPTPATYALLTLLGALAVFALVELWLAGAFHGPPLPLRVRAVPEPRPTPALAVTGSRRRRRRDAEGDPPRRAAEPELVMREEPPARRSWGWAGLAGLAALMALFLYDQLPAGDKLGPVFIILLVVIALFAILQIVSINFLSGDPAAPREQAQKPRAPARADSPPKSHPNPSPHEGTVP